MFIQIQTYKKMKVKQFKKIDEGNWKSVGRYESYIKGLLMGKGVPIVGHRVTHEGNIEVYIKEDWLKSHKFLKGKKMNKKFVEFLKDNKGFNLDLDGVEFIPYFTNVTVIA